MDKALLNVEWRSPRRWVQFNMLAPSKRLAWLDLLRAMAVLLVLWSHLVGGFLAAHQETWAPNDAINKYLFNPLVICQHGGFLGVSIFFMISGYIITRVLGRESPVQFVVRRGLRIFPLLFVVIVTVAALGFLGVPGMPPDAYNANFRSILTNALLINYIVHPQVVLVGPGWTLVIEICFYIISLLLLPLLNKSKLNPIILPISMLLVAALSSHFSRGFGSTFFLLSVSLSYLPILAAGSLFYLYESKSITSRVAALLFCGCWLTFLFSISILPEDLVNSYPISGMAAFLIFGLLFLKRNSYKQLPIILNWIALTSYSIYLWHGVVALPLQGLLFKTLGFSLTLIISLLATTIVSAFSYAWFEKPFQTLAKRLV